MYTEQDHTFVICAYGENPYVEETLVSLEQQTVRSQIKLSTSTPNDYLKDICARHGVEMLVNPEKKGAGADWNYAYDHAGTSLVTLAHQDDYYEPTFTEEVLAEARRYEGERVQMYFTDYFEMRKGARVASNKILKVKRILNAPLAKRFWNGRVWLKRRILAFGDPICCPACTYDRTVLGPSIFDTHYVNSCDYKTYVELASQAGRFVFIPKLLMGHRIYEGSATTKNLSENIRKREDGEILATLWPKPIAAMVNNVYATSESSNEL